MTASPPKTLTSRREPIISLITGGGDKPYALGMASCLIAQSIKFDFVGSNELDAPFLHGNPRVRFLNLHGSHEPSATLPAKIWRILRYYARLLKYTAGSEPRIFHILWNGKLEFFDRTLLLLYFKALGKRVVFTAHNVNARWRDGNDTFLNRLGLRIQYRLVAHIFVHTEEMMRELETCFAVPARKISVIPFGINSTLPKTALTTAEARHHFGFGVQERLILFFGNIAPYKGVEYLIRALGLLVVREPHYRLIIAGRLKDSDAYWQGIQREIQEMHLASYITERIHFIPDAETEIYFKAADVLVLPYTHIFQSGVLFLGYSFGLPVIASDVGSLRADIIENKTGIVCRPKDPESLAQALQSYFESPLYRNLGAQRAEIEAYAHARYSWDRVGVLTRAVYEQLS